MSVLRHSLWAAAAAVTLVGSRFAFAAILARRLPLEDFGQFAYGQWLAELTVMVCSFGAMGAISRYVAEYRHDSSLVSAVVRRWTPLAFGLPVLAAALVPAAVWVSGLAPGTRGIWFLALWTLTNGLWAMHTAALAGLQRFDLTLLANLAAAVVMIGGALLLPLEGMGAGAVFALMAVAGACAALVGVRATRRLREPVPAAVEPDRWQGMRAYALNVWVTALLWSLVWSRGEMPIVRAAMGDAGVAHYSATLVIFAGALQAVMLASAGVAPQLTRLWGEAAHTRAVALARRVMDAQLLVCGAGSVVLISFGPELMRLAFGDAFRSEAGTLAILSLGLVGLTVSCQNHLLQLDTDGRFTRNAMIAGLVALLGSAAVLIPAAGLTGASLSRAGTMLLMAVISLYYAWRRWGAAAWSAGNVGVIVLVVGASAAIQVGWPTLDWPVRTALAALAAVIMLVGVRDADGRLQVRLLLDRARLTT